MIPLKSIVIYSALVYLLFLNFFFIWKCQVFFVDTNKRELHTSELKTQEFLEPERPKTSQYRTGSRYKFLSPHVSLRILKELTKDIQLPNTDMELYGNGQIYLGFKQDSAYCEKRLAHFVQNPATLFNETNIVHSQNSLSFTSSVVSSFAKDLHAASITLKQLTGKTFFDMMPSIGAFFTGIPMYFFYDINKQAGCLSQMANHIPGCDNLARRPKLLQTIPTYLKKYENRPQCLAPNSIFPQTWVLSDKAMCVEFFDKINSPEYQKLKQERNIVYVKKLPKTPTTTGIILFNQEEEDKLITEYQNGALCGQTKTDVIMQQYIQNALLLNGQKFDFKSYLFIASTNPLVAYYHDGLLRVSVPNDQISADLALDKQVANIMNGEMVDPEEQLREAQQWSFARLQTYLLEKKLTKDKNWLDNYLRPEIKKVLVHLVRMSSDKFERHSSFYGFFEVDFMLDEDLKLWFVEVISGPAFSGYSKTSEKIIAQMMKDHFEIVFGLLRSRMKRVVNFVNSLVEQRTAYQTEAGKLVIENLEESKAIFKDITKNYFEKEYEPSRTNGFEKIIDEDYVGSAVYQGYLDKNCL